MILGVPMTAIPGTNVIGFDSFFHLYTHKAETVVRCRNELLGIFISSVITVLVPLSYATDFHKIFENNLPALATLFAGISVVPIFVYFFFEAKYRENKYHYMELTIKHLCENYFLSQQIPDLDRLNELIHEETCFSPGFTLAILVKLCKRWERMGLITIDLSDPETKGVGYLFPPS
jgi:hypothetical protein